MAETAFNLPTDEDEAAELAALVGSLEQPTGDAQLDAVASDALRIMQREQAELDRYTEAYGNELARIAQRYMTLTKPHEERQRQAQNIVHECARRAQYVGKAKSRKVGNGMYGLRQKPESVKIVDEDRLKTWLRVAAPDAIKQVTTEKVYQQDVKPVVLGHLKATGEVPPGVEHTGAHDEPFAKPLKEE